jgi:transcriptional regulator with XRE-family HTH domain
MADPKWFAGRLREIREQAGLTQQQLADKAGLTREGVAQLETGRRRPAWDTVVVLCSALGVDCNTFMQEPASQSAKRPPGRPPNPDAGATSDSKSAVEGTTGPSGKKSGKKHGHQRKGGKQQ